MSLRGLLAAAFLGVAPRGASAATDVFIGVAGSHESRQMTIGLPPFLMEQGQAGRAETALRLREVVRDDLLFSRWFKAVEPPSGEAAADPKGQAAAWKAAGAAFVLTAKVSDTPPKISVSITVHDLASGQAILERYYRQDSQYVRALAHQIADDIVKQFTGKPGVAHTQIAFVNDSTGHKEIYLADYDGQSLRRLTADNSINLLPRWSPDRSTLMFTSYRRHNPDLYAFNLAKSTIRPISEKQGLNLAGGFSPDGAKLVLTLSRGKSPNVFLMDVGGGNLTQLTNHFGVDASPTFSPDGRQIAFVSDRSGNPQVHTMDLSGGKAHRLTRLNWCDSPSWSPTGEWIVFAGRANSLDRMDIFLVDVTGSHIRQLTHNEGSNEDPAWSPDGRFITFTSNRDGKRKVYIMDADGSAPRLLGNFPGHSYTPAWSP
ncbi:MAG: Tol-Pal system beta propeller repeat protein TolB [Elusimicrobia bacterium]|nr:Tol-Pal system beta propeller repeat protein TolB [Elusimicrobiota bacterium]